MNLKSKKNTVVDKKDSGNLGYCGINCDSCSVRQFGLGNSNDTFISCCKNIPKSDLKCDGCKSDSVYAGCMTCILRECASSRQVFHCAECSDYPCVQYKKWQSVAKILPHANAAKANLEEVNRIGVDIWAERQKRHWCCTECGTPFSWYAKVCMKCQNQLTGKTFTLKGFKKLLCRFILPKVYKKGKLSKGNQ